MPIDTPAALVDEFKKTGEFERLRRELLAQFQQDESYSGFKEGVERIARKRLTNDQSIHFQTVETVLHELNQEIQRYPIVERTVTNFHPSSTILEGMQQTMQKILHDDNNPGSDLATPKDVKNGTTTRIEAIQTSGSQVQTPSIPNAQVPVEDSKVEGDSKAAEIVSTPVVTTVSESLDSEAPSQNVTKIADNLKVTPSAQSKSGSEETNNPTTAPSEPNAMDSEPSFSAISAESSNVRIPVDDQRETTTDVEMQDVQANS